MNIVIGLAMIVAGAYMALKSNWLVNNFGRIAFFDKYLGTEGGSRLGYKLIGLLVTFFGMLVLTNMIGGFMGWLLEPMLKYMRPDFNG